MPKNKGSHKQLVNAPVDAAVGGLATAIFNAGTRFLIKPGLTQKGTLALGGALGGYYAHRMGYRPLAHGVIGATVLALGQPAVDQGASMLGWAPQDMATPGSDTIAAAAEAAVQALSETATPAERTTAAQNAAAGAGADPTRARAEGTRLAAGTPLQQARTNLRVGFAGFAGTSPGAVAGVPSAALRNAANPQAYRNGREDAGAWIAAHRGKTDPVPVPRNAAEALPQGTVPPGIEGAAAVMLGWWYGALDEYATQIGETGRTGIERYRVTPPPAPSFDRTNAREIAPPAPTAHAPHAEAPARVERVASTWTQAPNGQFIRLPAE
jgi:hypothetical protein